jgi:hypothetical protein
MATIDAGSGLYLFQNFAFIYKKPSPDRKTAFVEREGLEPNNYL